MSPEAWIAFGALIFTIFLASGGAVWAISGKISTLNIEVDEEFANFRQAVNVECRDIRKEFSDGLEKAYRELSEAPKAIREKVNQIELFMRDEYLSKKDYDRDHDRLLKTIHLLQESIEKRFDKFEEKLDESREKN